MTGSSFCDSQSNWISNLLHDLTFRWQLRKLSCRLKHWLTLGFATWTVLVLGKASMKINSYELLKEWIHAFVAKLSNRCFCWFLAVMLVPLRVRATWHLHTSSVNLGKTFLWISWMWKIAPTCLLVMIFAYLLSFISQILDFIYLMDLINFLLSMAWQWKPVYTTFRHQNIINDNLWPSIGLKITFGPWPVMLIGQISFSSVMAGFWPVNYL